MWNSLDYNGVEEKKMNISIDYDDTYTKDPLLWNWFAQQALDRGHKVYCVSARSTQHMDDPKMTIGRIISAENCFGTGLRPKRKFMNEVQKIKIDVWIDDMPEMIVESEIEGLYML
jgi:hypothetical protein